MGRSEFLSVAIFALAIGTHGTIAAAETLRFGGTGSAQTTISLLGEAYTQRHPGTKIVGVANLGSSGGLKALAAGSIQLAAISRPLKAEELAQGLVAVEYGRSPFVFIANKPTVATITLAEGARMIDGSTARWPDGAPIRLILRPPKDGDTELLKSMSAEMAAAVDKALARDGMIVAQTDQDAVDKIEKISGSFGFSTLALILAENRTAAIVPVGGVMPGVATLADKSYAFHKTLYLVSKGPPSGEIRRFVDFVFSAEGQAILKRTGHWTSPQATPPAK